MELIINMYSMNTNEKHNGLVNPMQMEYYKKRYEAKALKPGEFGWEHGKYDTYAAARSEEGKLYFLTGDEAEDAIERAKMAVAQAQLEMELEIGDEEE